MKKNIQNTTYLVRMNIVCLCETEKITLVFKSYHITISNLEISFHALLIWCIIFRWLNCRTQWTEIPNLDWKFFFFSYQWPSVLSRNLKKDSECQIESSNCTLKLQNCKLSSIQMIEYTKFIKNWARVSKTFLAMCSCWMQSDANLVKMLSSWLGNITWISAGSGKK